MNTASPRTHPHNHNINNSTLLPKWLHSVWISEQGSEPWFSSSVSPGSSLGRQTVEQYSQSFTCHHFRSRTAKLTSPNRYCQINDGLLCTSWKNSLQRWGQPSVTSIQTMCSGVLQQRGLLSVTSRMQYRTERNGADSPRCTSTIEHTHLPPDPLSTS